MFTQKDYNSGDGIQTSVFGPIAWTFLHIISFNYPVNPSAADKKHYKEYILSLGKVLPCKYCRDNFDKNLAATGFTDAVFKNRDTFSRFIYKLHNNVNKMLDKKFDLSFEQVRDKYELLRARCVNDTPLLPKYDSHGHAHGHVHEKKEQGCVEPLYGTKVKSIIGIVPKSSNKETFTIDKKCKLSRSPSRGRKKSPTRARKSKGTKKRVFK